MFFHLRGQLLTLDMELLLRLGKIWWRELSNTQPQQGICHSCLHFKIPEAKNHNIFYYHIKSPMFLKPVYKGLFSKNRFFPKPMGFGFFHFASLFTYEFKWKILQWVMLKKKKKITQSLKIMILVVLKPEHFLAVSIWESRLPNQIFFKRYCITRHSAYVFKYSFHLALYTKVSM